MSGWWVEIHWLVNLWMVGIQMTWLNDLIKWWSGELTGILALMWWS